VILGAIFATIGIGYVEAGRPTPLPPLRSTPIALGPVYNSPEYSVVISDEQLSRVLARLRPRLAGNKTKINAADHALRFWGAEARFDDQRFTSGADLRTLLTDHRRFRELYGEAGDQKPLLIDRTPGVRVRVLEGDGSSTHQDHTVASLAEVGTALNFPVRTPAGQSTYRAMVEQVLRDFSLNQVEYEWSTMTFALFLPPTTSWQSGEGQQISFDRLAERIMRQEQPQGVCFGNHRLYALVVLLRVHEISPILSQETRAAIVEYLRDMTQRLVKNQHEDGFWNAQWPTTKPASRAPTEAEGDRLSDRIIATGHALEWWAMTPRELAAEIQPPRHVLASAGQWMVGTVDRMSDDEIGEHFTFLSHAGRALALWRGKRPHEVPLPDAPADK
jgi:hypothetical protein